MQDIGEAVSGSNPSQIMSWLEDGGDVNAYNADGNTILHLACVTGQDGLVQNLLRFPHLHLNMRNDQGCTPICLAARWGHIRCVQLIINAHHPVSSSSYVDFQVFESHQKLNFGYLICLNKTFDQHIHILYNILSVPLQPYDPWH